MRKSLLGILGLLTFVVCSGNASAQARSVTAPALSFAPSRVTRAVIAQPCGPSTPGPIRLNSAIRPPGKLVSVRPIAPGIDATGVVILETTIGVDGSVTAARVLRSIPALDQAALDAVKQWRFTPTCLNGVKVPVIMTQTVSFPPNGPDSDEPALAKIAYPVYPESALTSQVGGTLRVKLAVREDGSVAAVVFVESVPQLARAVHDAVTQWKYVPVHRDGVLALT